MGDRGDLLQAEFLLAAPYDECTEVTQGDVGHFDQDVAHLSPVLHLAGFQAGELLLQLLNNGRDAYVIDTGNRTVDGDRHLGGAVFDGRLDIIDAPDIPETLLYLIRKGSDLVQFLSLHLYDNGSTFAT